MFRLGLILKLPGLHVPRGTTHDTTMYIGNKNNAIVRTAKLE